MGRWDACVFRSTLSFFEGMDAFIMDALAGKLLEGVRVFTLLVSFLMNRGNRIWGGEMGYGV